MMCSRRRLCGRAGILAAILLATGLAAPPSHGKPRSRAPAPKSAPATIIAFTGLVLPYDTINGSAMAVLAERLQDKGYAAEAHAPDDWRQLAVQLTTTRRPAGPIVLVGYSLGAGASTSLAGQLGQAGLPVREMILVEAWNPDPVPANVERAVHYYLTGSAKMLTPAPGFSGSIQNIDLKPLIPGVEQEGHVSMSKVKAVQDKVYDEVIRAISAPARRPR